MYPDSKNHGANMGPNWGRQDPDGTDNDHLNLAIWVTTLHLQLKREQLDRLHSENILAAPW